MNIKVYIISTMRSGSTLLKALLATNPEISDLPEIHFRKSHEVVSQKPVVVIKAPAYFTEMEYPQLPELESKKLLLIRNPYDTIISLKNMNIATNVPASSIFHKDLVLLSYWVNIYQNLIDKFVFTDKDICIVRYEDLIANPIMHTERIFKFIGVKDTKGIDSYFTPENYEWKWSSDDGGDIIKTLKVQNNKTPLRDNDLLLKLIKLNKEKIEIIMSNFGYKDLSI